MYPKVFPQIEFQKTGCDQHQRSWNSTTFRKQKPKIFIVKFKNNRPDTFRFHCFSSTQET